MIYQELDIVFVVEANKYKFVCLISLLLSFCFKMTQGLNLVLFWKTLFGHKILFHHLTKSFEKISYRSFKVISDDSFMFVKKV